MTLMEFLDMGGYAFYVWTAYGLGLIVLLANLVEPIRRERKLLREIARKARLARKER
jgi:heme exporter protein D